MLSLKRETALFTEPYLTGGVQSLTLDLGFLSLARLTLPEPHRYFDPSVYSPGEREKELCCPFLHQTFSSLHAVGAVKNRRTIVP